ncbi:hypothetical protein, partial [Lactococcus petauri]
MVEQCGKTPLELFQVLSGFAFDVSQLWSYTIKVDRKLCVIICLLRHKNERIFMSGFKRYDEEFKQSLVNLY